jgi:hypothetical protein
MPPLDILLQRLGRLAAAHGSQHQVAGGRDSLHMEATAPVARRVHRAPHLDAVAVVELGLVRRGQRQVHLLGVRLCGGAREQLGDLVQQVINCLVREGGHKHSHRRAHGRAERVEEQSADQRGGEVGLAASRRPIHALEWVAARPAENELLTGREGEGTAEPILDWLLARHAKGRWVLSQEPDRERTRRAVVLADLLRELARVRVQLRGAHKLGVSPGASSCERGGGL